MIKNKCFEIEHIKKKSQEIKTDPILIERAIYAFELLSLLIERNIPLVFKGGTSLMLLIPEFNRLSIDIDIVTDEREKTLENTFREPFPGRNDLNFNPFFFYDFFLFRRILKSLFVLLSRTK